MVQLLLLLLQLSSVMQWLTVGCVRRPSGMLLLLLLLCGSFAVQLPRLRLLLQKLFLQGSKLVSR